MRHTIKLKTGQTLTDCHGSIALAMLYGCSQEKTERAVYFPLIQATADVSNITLSGAYISAIMKEVDSSI